MPNVKLAIKRMSTLDELQHLQTFRKHGLKIVSLQDCKMLENCNLLYFKLLILSDLFHEVGYYCSQVDANSHNYIAK